VNITIGILFVLIAALASGFALILGYVAAASFLNWSTNQKSSSAAVTNPLVTRTMVRCE
jgi:hypothetical protein